MVETGKVVLTIERSLGKTVPGRKLILGNGRRGPMAPGPGGALLIRWARCRCTPCEPKYPTSKVVCWPRLFSTDKLHCSMYCEGALGSKDPKLTVVCPRTGLPKLKCELTMP